MNTFETNQQWLTWKTVNALENSTLVWSEVIFPERILHLTSESTVPPESFCPFFCVKVFRRGSGSFSSPPNMSFCKTEWIFLQSVQQNHFPFGSSCSTYGINTNNIQKNLSMQRPHLFVPQFKKWVIKIIWFMDYFSINEHIFLTLRLSILCCFKQPTWYSFSHYKTECKYTVCYDQL